MNQLIVYEGEDEVLITTPENEPLMLKEWFDEADRNVDDYDRTVSKEVCIKVTPSLSCDM